MIALFCMTAIGAWAQEPDWLQAGDTWDSNTKTLTVNNNPEKHAYDSNTEILHVVFAANVTTIGQAAFQYSGLQTIFFEEDSQLKTIGDYAFVGSALTAITIPASVTTMGRAPFRDCRELTTVTFEENSQLETISEAAFEGCHALSVITMPASLTTIEDLAFEQCDALKKMIIPASVTYIGEFAFDNCLNLSVINILAQTPPTLGTNVFERIAENFRIYVPRESVDAYKTAYPDLADRIKPIMGEQGTGIVPIDNGQLIIDNCWYTLDGRKLSSKPTAKGVYIYNGKIRVIK